MSFERWLEQSLSTAEMVSPQRLLNNKSTTYYILIKKKAIGRLLEKGCSSKKAEVFDVCWWCSSISFPKSPLEMENQIVK